MTTHITDAKQAVDYYMQSVPSETTRLRSLIDTYGDWTGAAEQVRICLGTPQYQLGNARGDEHSATVENIADELRRRAEEHGVALTLQEFLQRDDVRELLDEYAEIEAENRNDEKSARNLHRSLLATESRRLNDPAPSVASRVIPKFEARSKVRQQRLDALARQINALAAECGRDAYIIHGGGADE